MARPNEQYEIAYYTSKAHRKLSARCALIEHRIRQMELVLIELAKAEEQKIVMFQERNVERRKIEPMLFQARQQMDVFVRHQYGLVGNFVDNLRSAIGFDERIEIEEMNDLSRAYIERTAWLGCGREEADVRENGDSW
jgi:hypothetical protein